MAAIKESASERVYIRPLNMQEAHVRIEGTAPLVQLAFSQKARNVMLEKQIAGSTARKNRQKASRDVDADFANAQHRSVDGWAGIPAASLRAAMIRACSLAGFTMTAAKMSVFVEADGLEADGTPLVRLDAGDPVRVEHAVRNATGVADIRIRPMWTEWAADLRIRYDADQFTTADVLNLLERAGQQVGIGEGRPFSKNSAGMGWGTFHVAREA